MTIVTRSIYVYIYSYIDNEIQGKGIGIHDYLSLAADSPGIYYKYDYNGEWSVLEVTDFGSYNTLHNLEVPKEVKIHHLLTN